MSLPPVLYLFSYLFHLFLAFFTPICIIFFLQLSILLPPLLVYPYPAPILTPFSFYPFSISGFVCKPQGRKKNGWKTLSAPLSQKTGESSPLMFLSSLLLQKQRLHSHTDTHTRTHTLWHKKHLNYLLHIYRQTRTDAQILVSYGQTFERKQVPQLS